MSGVPHQRDIRPEELPPEEDIKKLERRIKSQDRKSLGSDEMLKNQIEKDCILLKILLHKYFENTGDEGCKI